MSGSPVIHGLHFSALKSGRSTLSMTDKVGRVFMHEDKRTNNDLVRDDPGGERNEMLIQ